DQHAQLQELKLPMVLGLFLLKFKIRHQRFTQWLNNTSGTYLLICILAMIVNLTMAKLIACPQLEGIHLQHVR
ncbi:hypothetical protein AB4491_30720, partial [Vibrio sp. 10N.261.45.A7]